METTLIVSRAYFKLLNSIDWEDDVLLSGLREGLNKFLSNAFLKINKKRKYDQADFYSQAAIEKILVREYSSLIYEHMVPKKAYIQDPCEDEARDGKLTIDFVVDHLERYWQIAVITDQEDRRLERSKMPHGWDKKDIHARYQQAGVILEAASDVALKYEIWASSKKPMPGA